MKRLSDDPRASNARPLAATIGTPWLCAVGACLLLAACSDQGGGGSSPDGAGGTGGQGADGAQAGPVRIMALGDSITRATCWRALLWQRLRQTYESRFDLVGTVPNDPGCGVAGFDADNQGYSSSLVTEVVAGVTDARTCDPSPCPSLDDVQAAFATARPDVVLMHWGTNDVWNNRPASTIASGYTAILAALRDVNPSVVVLLAQIIPMNVTSATCSGCSCSTCPAGISALNGQIPTYAATNSTASSEIIVVDQHTGFDAVADTEDGVHPNAQGSQKIADRWYVAITENGLIP